MNISYATSYCLRSRIGYVAMEMNSGAYSLVIKKWCSESKCKKIKQNILWNLDKYHLLPILCWMYTHFHRNFYIDENSNPSRNACMSSITEAEEGQHNGWWRQLYLGKNCAVWEAKGVNGLNFDNLCFRPSSNNQSTGSDWKICLGPKY